MNIEQLISNQRPGFTLDQVFYCSDVIFEEEVQKLFSNQWLPLDHASRIPNPGDYFLTSIVGESIIIVRGKDDQIYAHYNVCRHRGSKVCVEPEGNVSRLTCPYHAWTYNLNGSLVAARLMHEGFKKEDYGLKPCHLRVHDGLIFINLSTGTPPDFDEMIAPLLPFISLHGLDDAKIAHREVYPTDANWKLVLDNFFECYHCAPAHPEYSRVHSAAKLMAFGAGPDSGSEDAMKEFEPEMVEWQARAQELGHFTGSHAARGVGSFQGAMRAPIKRGSLSETRDGTPVSTLMGKFKDFDGGQTAVSFNPFGTLLMSNDFAVLLRFIPHSATRSDMEVIWMVRADAVEGKDYDLEKLIWVWDVTTKQDKDIIEWNKAGVMSRHYEPGPYSTQEAASAKLIEWYLARLSGT
jgi:phenylpropionate dioxygenase-like ring-hydroxylating dioxygenase large terminal subunit